jgi:hypothetical protein
VIPLNRRQLAVLAVLGVVVVLYLVATAAGARNGSGGGGVRGGDLPQTLGGVLVLPAASGDVVATAPGCRRGGDLTAAAGRACLYRLKSGFLGKRLRLRLQTGTQVTAVLVQPKPEVTDTETLDGAHPSVDLVFRQDGSTLMLSCGSDQKQGCAARLG